MKESLFDELVDKIKGKGQSVVFPEATDERILTAASQLAASGILTPILIADVKEISQRADELNFDLMVETLVDRRKGKATKEQAEEMLLDGNYFGTMLVYMNQADGLVSGATHSTADTVRPALQIIKTKEGVKRTSGVFVMVRDD